MSELKPCPFCGGEATIARSAWFDQVTCKECRVSTAPCRTVDEAIEAWNTRHEPHFVPIANITFTAEQQDEVFQRVMKEMQAKKPTLVLYENEAEVCPECGEPLPDYANFCPNCGAKVVGE